ncbi:MFS transporter [Altererythrobacter sp. RZ02]|uniref:MFS transporter n=1 Tax=Pontixanthobacter rizhaonensis TaxID=2730337 RepID=A0A848QQT5_9SPHN|nr:MFS transporter [Pontixanthobacter rizhaonensis]NMW31468.1 MFS transporter [Pontixanthobacter rizhaonensis]
MANTNQPSSYLSRKAEFTLATVGGIIVANAYYIHPIISEVADDFSVSASTIGLVPAFNQIALALGIFLLLPLGDRYSNRRLSILFAAGQTISLGIMVLANSFIVFLVGSTILGFFTIGPYLLPTYASKRVSPDRLGSVTATLTVGTIFGILIARTGAGVIAQYFEWQLIYIIAACLMIGTTISLPFIMEGRRETSVPEDRPNYFRLVGSLFPLLRQHPQVFVSGIIQAFNFGIFLSVWLGLALHLTSPAMGYGVDIVGYLAAFAVVAIFATPRLGKWADKIGPEKARLRLALVQMAGVALLYPLGQNLWLLMIPVVVMNTVGPGIDVTGRMTSLSLAPEIRTRLMTGYIVLMFVGAGFASWVGTASYEWAGWAGSSAMAFALSAGLVGLSWHQARAALPHSVN